MLIQIFKHNRIVRLGFPGLYVILMKWAQINADILFRSSSAEFNTSQNTNASQTPQTGANAKLRYQITSGNTMGAFDVEPEVGTIFIAQRLDYEQVQRYELRLVASDGKWENQTTVVINVINQNDEAPIFTQTEYQTSVTEELTDLPVFVLEVSG